jgi:hypothetical protein
MSRVWRGSWRAMGSAMCKRRGRCEVGGIYSARLRGLMIHCSAILSSCLYVSRGLVMVNAVGNRMLNVFHFCTISSHHHPPKPQKGLLSTYNTNATRCHPSRHPIQSGISRTGTGTSRSASNVPCRPAARPNQSSICENFEITPIRTCCYTQMPMAASPTIILHCMISSTSA